MSQVIERESIPTETVIFWVAPPVEAAIWRDRARLEEMIGKLPAELDDLPEEEDSFLKHQLNHDLLTREEETFLFTVLDQGRKAKQFLEEEEGENKETLLAVIANAHKAYQAIVGYNQRLVFSEAVKKLGRGLPLNDLTQEGNEGLFKAIERFDLQRGRKFSTYAVWWIRQSLNRAVADLGQNIRLPVYIKDLIRKTYKVRRQFVIDENREPTPEELAALVGWKDPSWMTTVLRLSVGTMSLDTPVHREDPSSGVLSDFVESPKDPPPETTVIQKMLQEKIEELSLALTAREQRVLELHFGLRDGQAFTLDEIGQRFDLSRERIRQIVNKALRKLRHPARAGQLKDFA